MMSAVSVAATLSGWEYCIILVFIVPRRRDAPILASSASQSSGKVGAEHRVVQAPDRVYDAG